MKTTLPLKWLLSLFFIAAGLTTTSQNRVTLNLSKPTNPSQITLNEKGYWTETYNTSEQYRWIEFDLFKFTHIPNAFGGDDVGGGMSYWDGFTYCTSGDMTDYGESGSSAAWVAEQWGCMPGGGIKTDADGNVMKDESGKVLVQKGNPYLVAYWGYWIELNQDGKPCLQVKFTDGKQYQPEGIYIANHPWPYYGNIHGDGFARAFEQEGDFFKLTIHGMNSAGEATGAKVDHLLAEFKNGELIQSPDWNWVDLSSLGTVSGLYFTMTTSDADPIYGPNTAVYFCLDKLQVKVAEETTAPSRPTGLKANPMETRIHASWSASTSPLGVKGYNLYLNGQHVAFEESTSYSFIGLQPFTHYQIEVEAIANDGIPSEKAAISAKTTDVTPPTMPLKLNGTTTTYTMTISWEASTDNVAVTEYHIYLNGERQKKVNTTSHTFTGLDADTEYLVEVEARDAAGNRSKKAAIRLKTMSLSTGVPASMLQTIVKYSGGFIEIENPDANLLQIFNLNGQLQLSQAIEHNISTRINISHLPKGLYFMKLGSHTHKIIKH